MNLTEEHIKPTRVYKSSRQTLSISTAFSGRFRLREDSQCKWAFYVLQTKVIIVDTRFIIIADQWDWIFLHSTHVALCLLRWLASPLSTQTFKYVEMSNFVFFFVGEKHRDILQIEMRKIIFRLLPPMCVDAEQIQEWMYKESAKILKSMSLLQIQFAVLRRIWNERRSLSNKLFSKARLSGYRLQRSR